LGVVVVVVVVVLVLLLLVLPWVLPVWWWCDGDGWEKGGRELLGNEGWGDG
jgi:hypothetical protein